MSKQISKRKFMNTYEKITELQRDYKEKEKRGSSEKKMWMNEKK